MALTKITADVLADNTITEPDLATTGTASSATTLHGNDTWATVSSSGLLNVAAADPGTGQTAGNTWYLSGLVDFVTDTNLLPTAWTTASPLPQVIRYHAGCGTQTAALSFGGESDSGVSNEYDGGAWAAGGNLITGHDEVGGFGSQSAGVCIGGYPASGNTQEYDGTSWTTGNTMTARYGCMGAGTLTAGLAIGGWAPSVTGLTEEYDGTSWSAGGAMNTPRGQLAAAGIQTAAFAAGGDPSAGSNTAASEEYNGTAWTAGNSINTARRNIRGAGLMTAGLCFGGYVSAPSAVTESYDGTTWTAVASMVTVDNGPGNAGSQGAALSFGGTDASSATAATEHFNKTTIEFVAV